MSFHEDSSRAEVSEEMKRVLFSFIRFPDKRMFPFSHPRRPRLTLNWEANSCSRASSTRSTYKGRMKKRRHNTVLHTGSKRAIGSTQTPYSYSSVFFLRRFSSLSLSLSLSLSPSLSLSLSLCRSFCWRLMLLCTLRCSTASQKGSRVQALTSTNEILIVSLFLTTRACENPVGGTKTEET